MEYLRELLREDPNEPFLHYAICLELKKNGDDALNAFLEMKKSFPGYLPLYYQLALLLAETGNTEEAALISSEGIVLAESLGDQHALAELKGLRQDIVAGEYD